MRRLTAEAATFSRVLAFRQYGLYLHKKIGLPRRLEIAFRMSGDRELHSGVPGNGRDG